MTKTGEYDKFYKRKPGIVLDECLGLSAKQGFFCEKKKGKCIFMKKSQKKRRRRKVISGILLLAFTLMLVGCNFENFTFLDEMKTVTKAFLLYSNDKVNDVLKQQYALSVDEEEEIIEEAEPEEAEESQEEINVEPEAEAELPAGYQIENFPIIYQNPELPTGCESTALTMVLNYYGYPADKVVMATEYLPQEPFRSYINEEGKEIGPDLEETFVGDPTTSNGIICMTKPIMIEANAYLEDQGSSLTAVDISGVTFDDLYRCVSNDQPVVVWVTIGMVDRQVARGWYTEDGDYVEYSRSDHGAVLIGYTETTVTIADPISGLVEYSREQFEKVFASRENRAVILEELK